MSRTLPNLKLHRTAMPPVATDIFMQVDENDVTGIVATLVLDTPDGLNIAMLSTVPVRMTYVATPLATA